MRLAILALAACLGAAGHAGRAAAQNLEGVLMPGPVVSGHAKYETDCRKCHTPFNKAAQRDLCLDCHKPIAEEMRDPKRLHGNLTDSTCRLCHTDHKGRNARIIAVDLGAFDHDRTRFPLRDAHRKAAEKCESCHVAGKKYRDAPRRCNACHAKDDVHKGKLGDRCEACHNEARWKDATFDHNKTRFKLELGHANVACDKCHADQSYKGAPLRCVECHRKDDDTKGHKGHFGRKCESCHTAASWKKSTFDHAAAAHYALRGKHASAKCASCHVKPLYTVRLPTGCYACHRKDDDERGHRGSLGEKCGDCHNEQGWKNLGKFDHDKDTEFPLTGKHRKARCDACHTAGVTAAKGRVRDKLPTNCYGCHRKDDDKKGHKGKFGAKCDACHTTVEWKDIRFRHDRDTKFPLRGKHAKTRCAACHTGQLYKDKTPKDCVACHRKDDEKRGHKGKLGPRCDVCHSEASWRVERFDHNKSRFPLVGAHGRLECGKCHRSLEFKDVPLTCYGCHEKDDTHRRRLGTACERCHDARSWKSWDFDHGKTAFPLDGAHRKPDCYACHKAPMQTRAGLIPARSCMACHAEDDVHHGTYGALCGRCHTAESWRVILRR